MAIHAALVLPLVAVLMLCGGCSAAMYKEITYGPAVRDFAGMDCKRLLIVNETEYIGEISRIDEKNWDGSYRLSDDNFIWLSPLLEEHMVELYNIRLSDEDRHGLLNAIGDFDWKWDGDECVIRDEGHEARLVNFLKLGSTRQPPNARFGTFAPELPKPLPELANFYDPSVDITAIQETMIKGLDKRWWKAILPAVKNYAAMKILPNHWQDQLNGVVFVLNTKHEKNTAPAVSINVAVNHAMAPQYTDEQGQLLWDTLLKHKTLLPNSVKAYYAPDRQPISEKNFKMVDVSDKWLNLRKVLGGYYRVTKSTMYDCLFGNGLDLASPDLPFQPKEDLESQKGGSRYFCVDLIDFFPAAVEKLNCRSVEFLNKGGKVLWSLESSTGYDPGKLIRLDGGIYKVTLDFLRIAKKDEHKFGNKALQDWVWELTDTDVTSKSKRCVFKELDLTEFMQKLIDRSKMLFTAPKVVDPTRTIQRRTTTLTQQSTTPAQTHQPEASKVSLFDGSDAHVGRGYLLAMDFAEASRSDSLSLHHRHPHVVEPLVIPHDTNTNLPDASLVNPTDMRMKGRKQIIELSANADKAETRVDDQAQLRSGSFIQPPQSYTPGAMEDVTFCVGYKGSKQPEDIRHILVTFAHLDPRKPIIDEDTDEGNLLWQTTEYFWRGLLEHGVIPMTILHVNGRKTETLDISLWQHLVHVLFQATTALTTPEGPDRCDYNLFMEELEVVQCNQMDFNFGIGRTLLVVHKKAVPMSFIGIPGPLSNPLGDWDMTPDSVTVAPEQMAHWSAESFKIERNQGLTKAAKKKDNLKVTSDLLVKAFELSKLGANVKTVESHNSKKSEKPEKPGEATSKSHNSEKPGEATTKFIQSTPWFFKVEKVEKEKVKGKKNLCRFKSALDGEELQVGWSRLRLDDLPGDNDPSNTANSHRSRLESWSERYETLDKAPNPEEDESSDDDSSPIDKHLKRLRKKRLGKKRIWKKKNKQRRKRKAKRRAGA